MAKTKIIVLQMKEIIYTAIFVALGILLILLLIVMFLPSDKEEKTGEVSHYKSGVYTSEIKLGNNSLNLEIVVDSEQIKSVSLVNLEDSITTMYPLVQPSVSYLEEELIKGVAPDDITLTEKGKYTQTLLIEGIKTALSHAPNPSSTASHTHH